MDEEQKLPELQKTTLSLPKEEQEEHMEAPNTIGDQSEEETNKDETATQEEKKKLHDATVELAKIAGLKVPDALQSSLQEETSEKISLEAKLKESVANKKHEQKTVESPINLSAYMKRSEEDTTLSSLPNNKQPEKKGFWRSVKNFWKKTKKVIHDNWPQWIYGRTITRERYDMIRAERRNKQQLQDPMAQFPTSIPDQPQQKQPPLAA